jgi:hypothetical protein
MPPDIHSIIMNWTSSGEFSEEYDIKEIGDGCYDLADSGLDSFVIEEGDSCEILW